MKDPQNDEQSILLKIALRLYNSGYNRGHNDTVESSYIDILECDMENFHQEECLEIVQDFLGNDLTDSDLEYSPDKYMKRSEETIEEWVEKFEPDLEDASLKLCRMISKEKEINEDIKFLAEYISEMFEDNSPRSMGWVGQDGLP